MKTQSVIACIALGSNLGDRALHVREGLRAIGELPSTELVKASSFVETAPVRVSAADPGGTYINGAAVIETGLDARELLGALRSIEADAGREHTRSSHGAARTLDLDLLLYGDEVIDQPDLKVPHPQLQKRLFVLGPLSEIAPDLMIPSLGKSVLQLHQALLLESGTASRQPSVN